MPMPYGDIAPPSSLTIDLFAMLPASVRDSGGCCREELAPVELKLNVTISLGSAANHNVSARNCGENDLDFKICLSPAGI